MPDLVYRKNPRLLSEELAGEEVILNTASGDYFTLNEVGKRFWELLDGVKTLPQINAIMAREYEVEPEVLTEDLKELLDDLLLNKLIEAD